MKSRLTVGWALGGVSILFGSAVFRLGSRGVATVRGGLDSFHLAALAVVVVAFVYGEGVRAIQRKYAPHLLGRVADVSRETRVVYRLLAPFYAMSLVGAPPRSLIRAWAGVAAIVSAILVLRVTPDPWRGIVDLGVALALAWGLVAILVQAWKRGVPPSDG